MPKKPITNEPIPEKENLDQELPKEGDEGNDEVIVNPHIRAALDDKAILARDSENSADSFMSWTRSG